MMAGSTLFLLDNIDSFSYNLVDEFRKLGFSLTVFRNTVPAPNIIEQMRACGETPLLILSPGPGTPSEAGCMPDLIRLAKKQFPILGICLGHQAIVESYGGKILRAPEVLHGKASLISHTGDRMFEGMPNPLPVARYHSLMACEMPEELNLLAWYNDIPMAVYHEADRVLGYQFHPESILTTRGGALLKQSIRYLIDNI